MSAANELVDRMNEPSSEQNEDEMNAAAKDLLGTSGELGSVHSRQSVASMMKSASMIIQKAADKSKGSGGTSYDEQTEISDRHSEVSAERMPDLVSR